MDVNGVSCTQPGDVERAFVTYFQTILTTSNPSFVNECISSIESKVSRAMNDKLLASFSGVDVKVALDQMEPLKAPGPNGFSAKFINRIER
jgi:hypothetical protein